MVYAMSVICTLTPGCTPELHGDLLVHSPHCLGLPGAQHNVEVTVTVEVALAVIGALTNEQRLEVMGNFCHGCGRADPSCRCWDDP